MNPAEPAFLTRQGLQLLLFGGKGGVGKTTCATATALRLAARAPERDFLLVSTDPAHSVQDSLAGLLPPTNLRVLELDAKQYLAAFREKNGPTLRAIAAAGTFLDDEDIRQFLSLSLPGLDELMAFLEITSWVGARQYDCIVVDTAPSGHTLRLLAMPDLIRKWLGMLEALLAKRRYMRRVFGRNSHPDRLDRFVTGWKTSLARMESLLRDPARSQFVPVSIAEVLSVRETLDLLRELRARKIPVSDLIANRLHRENGCAVCSWSASAEQATLQRLVDGMDQSCRLWGIPLFPDEVRGLQPLTGFWDNVRPVTPTSRRLSPAAVALDLPIEDPPLLPSAGAQIILFGGKGGVGKTTLACATAVQLAQCSPPRRVLLFSTDPAHSLSGCLQTTIGARPAALFPGLTAIEIDPQAEFKKLKERYAEDVQRFLESITRNLDLTFDRLVLEKVMDLAPPGLDEIMALTRVMEFLAEDRYDLFVLDCAPTGHLIRLLELPDLINDWLKAFFNLFLKYEQLLRLPRFADTLVEISRNLKHLRELLLNQARSMLYAVCIPTQMALEETKDLVLTCEQMGMSVPNLFVNLMTPPGDCRLCSSLRRRELSVTRQLRQMFPQKRLTRIYRWREIDSREQIASFGRQLYQSSREELINCASF